jgi:hypothetical protein
VVEQGVAQLVVFGLVLMGEDDDVPGGEAVVEGVAGGADLAVVGAGTGGAQGIAAIRRDLFEGRHKSTYLLSV